MKIWVDDIREPDNTNWIGDPDGWFWLKTSDEAIEFLDGYRRLRDLYGISPVDYPRLMSLDHDLGGDDTTRPIVIWMIENDFWPVEVVCHSANPVGIDWIEGMIARYKP